MNETQRLKLYTSAMPNVGQKKVQDMKFYAFIHYTVNTFTDLEWGTGKEPESVFNPLNQNTDSWCEAVKSAGMKGIILTCKHHDGFCLWQTKTTKHSIAFSPYKNGKGDVVREVADSCRKYGLEFGVYLSPWDRNSPYYATNKYNDFYIEQLTELLSNYGKVFALWLDGACGAADDGKVQQFYDFKRIWSTAKKLQPDICLSGCAPDVRWVGNESGVSRESEWNVVPEFRYEMQNFEVNCSSDDAQNYKNRCKDVYLRDMGSREFLKDYNKVIWYPAEVDVSIRKGWFWHKSENNTVKSLNTLMDIYYKSVGGNSLLLLNIPPDNNGLFHKNDVARLAQMGNEIKKMQTLKIDKVTAGKMLVTQSGYEMTFSFNKCKIDRVNFEEDTDFSQRIEAFNLYANVNGEKRLIYSGTVVGFGKLAIFEPVTTSELSLVITSCRFEPHLRFFNIYKSGAYRVKQL